MWLTPKRKTPTRNTGTAAEKLTILSTKSFCDLMLASLKLRIVQGSHTVDPVMIRDTAHALLGIASDLERQQDRSGL